MHRGHTAVGAVLGVLFTLQVAGQSVEVTCQRVRDAHAVVGRDGLVALMDEHHVNVFRRRQVWRCLQEQEANSGK